MSHSSSNHNETKHEPNHPAGTPQSQETGGNQQRVSADSVQGETECAKLARIFPCPRSYIHPAYANGDWGTDVARLRAESYARACRSRAAVLCASTDARPENPSSVYRTAPGSVSRTFDASAYVGESEFLRTEDPS